MTKEINLAYTKSAEYYDRIYENHKNVNYDEAIDDFIYLYKEITGKELHSIIDYGCGTGTQTILFKQKGIDSIGVDLSKDQINVAKMKANNLNIDATFEVANISDFKTKKQYDAGGAFFSPFNYLLTDEEVLKFFESAEHNIVDGGVLYFEFWHTLALRPDTSSFLIKEFEDGMKIYRMNNVEFDIETSIASMDMHHVITKNQELITEFTEHHKLRTYTIPQLKALIKQSNWKLVEIFSGTYNRFSGFYKRSKSERTPTRDDFRLYPILQKEQ